MAKSVKTVTSKISDIQSRAQEAIQTEQKKVASSTQATQGWSTTTPTVTDTPKVTSTAKAMPSITRPDISSIVPTQTTTQPKTTTTVNAKDLLWSKTQVTPLKKAATPDLLSTKTEEKEIKNTTIPLNIVRSAINVWWQAAQTIADSLYNQWLDWINSKINKLDETRQKVTDTVGKTAIDLFKWVGSDLSQQWQSWEWLWATKDAVLNTIQWLPRWIARIEYWVSELLDWVADTDWSESIKQSFKSDLEYWENTKTYQKVKETESFSDFLKNPIMYAWGTLGEMLPMFINAWVAVPTTFAQIYWETYSDYSQDTSLQEAWLSDNQVRLMSLWVAWVNTIIELWSDLVQWLMPWTKTVAKWTEKEIRRSLSKPIANIFRKVGKWWISEWFEEVFQDEILNQVAGFFGSDREMPTRASRLTTWGISSIVWGILQWGNVNIEINKHKELEAAFNEWSEAVDDIAPWVSQKDKQALFSAIVAAQVEDMQMSEDKVNKYEAETTELYNAIEDLTNQLEAATDEKQKEQIKNQIDLANKRINTIDEMINKAKKVEEEVTAKLQFLSEQRQQEQEVATEEELPAVKQGIQMPSEVEWKNLSEQAMKAVELSEEEEKKSAKLPSTDYEYTSLASALNQPSNTYLQELSDEDLKKLHDNTFDRWKGLMDEEIYWWPMVDATRVIIRKVNEEVARREKESAEKATKKSETEKTETKTKMKFKDAKDYVNKMIEIDKRNWVWSRSDDKRLRKAYMSDFIRTNLEWDFAAHLPWLKNVNLKQIKWKLTDKDIRDIAEMLSLVSTTLWIDFNKVIQDKDMSMNIVYDIKDFLYNTWALWLMSWEATKQMVKDLAERSWERINPSFWADLAKMWVALTLQEWPMKSAATMAHELMHLIDFALSTEEWLPLYFEKWKITYTSIIKDDSSWKTYTKGNYDKDYYNRRQEILARYAEQYFAYKNDKEIFDKFAKRPWYWTEEEFLKLVPKFESFIKDRLWAKLLDEQNQFYNEVVRKINENVFKTTQIEFAERDDMTESEVKYKLTQLEAEYAWILQTVEWMKWDLKDEMEAYVQLSNIQSNYEMAKAKWEEYLEKLKTTPEQQDTIDDVTETVIPNPPQDTWTIRYWLPYFWWGNIEEWIGDIIEWWKWEKLWESYTKEEDIIKIRKKSKKIKWFFKELWQAWQDVFTPAISRIYNISPRVAWRLITMETQTDINIYRYRQKAKWFVASLWKLKGKQAIEVKAALLNYWALASEQWADIAEYKGKEVAKLKEVLLRNGFKEKDINDMFEVLNDIWRQYEDAWLKITLSDMYFPRVVKDYEWLIDYMNRVSGKDIKANKVSLMIKIRNIQADPDMTEEEKEKKIRNAISIEFKRPWTTSEHGKERTMWDLSSWWEWIYAYYENPIEALDHYITTMTKAIQRQLFLWWMKEDAEITESDILNQNTAESVSTIIWNLVEQWKVSEDDVEELQKSILAVLNKKRSPKSVTAIKDITYISTITNFLSAINQLDDLWMVILKDRSWLKHIVKTIFGKAWIKYDDLWLEDAYEMFREEWWITNWLFKKSFFNMFDRLGKTSFINTAWQSMIRQSKNEKTRGYLYTRLQAMYWTESADRMMEKIDSGNYMTDGQIDIEILRDLLYQLWSTQPIYTSAMPTTYLNHPRARLCYALSSFTLKRIDWLVQWTKEVNAQHWKVAAAAWLMWVSSFLAMFWAAIWDVWDLLKWKKEETFLWNLINKWIDDALAAWWSDALDSWLKIWDLSEYDIKTYKSQWLWWVLSAKLKPFVFDLGKDVVEAVWEHDLDEITDLAKYVPIFWKLTYYWFWDELWKSTKKSKEKKDEWDFWEDDWSFEEDDWDWWEEDEWDWSEEEWDWDEEDWGF